MTRSLSSIAAALIALAGAVSVHAAGFQFAERVNLTFSLHPGATLYIDNAAGNITVVGGDAPAITVTAVKVIRAADEAAFNEAKAATQIVPASNERSLTLRTHVNARGMVRWSSAVNYQLAVPRGTAVRLNTRSADLISVSNIEAAVEIKNMSGTIRLMNLRGPVSVDSVNGSIIFEGETARRTDVRLSTVNGTVQVVVPGDAKFNWVAETLGGEFHSGFRPNGAWNGPRYEALMNGGGATIRAASLMGRVLLLARGSNVAPQRVAPPQITPQPQQATKRKTHLALVPAGTYSLETTMGDIQIDEARGDVRLKTGAGDIDLGLVRGFADVLSLGGPLRMGEIMGPLRANTKAGDIQVSAARQGGSLYTGGGIIRLLHAGGPTRLESGGGDIVVRQANAAIWALTKSGDISITIDGNAKTQKVYAKTAKGSVTLNVSAGFGADVDATVVTTDAEANNIRTDLTGLSIQREQINGKTRIRATGKVNGGGDRVELFAEDGGILISSAGAAR